MLSLWLIAHQLHVSGGFLGDNKPWGSSAVLKADLITDTTEYVHLDDSLTNVTLEEGPMLPMKVASHCFVKISEAAALLVGGSIDGIGRTASVSSFVFNTKEVTWTQGADLKQSRSDHACGVLKVGQHQQSQIVVVAVGGKSSSGLDSQLVAKLDSAEIWIESSNVWIESQPLPEGVRTAGTLTWNTMSSLLVIGGTSSTKRKSLSLTLTILTNLCYSLH